MSVVEQARDGSKHEPKDFDPDEGFVEERSVQQQWLEYALMCFCNIAWTIDASILPAFFHEFQIIFGVSQTALNGLSSAKGITAALFGFPCGFVAEVLPRPTLIGFGMLFWAAGLLICTVAPSFEVIFLGRVLNGMGLGIVQPLLLSLVADKTAPTKRGSAFGSIFFVGAVCNTLFTLFATKYTAAKVGTIPGWRISLLIVSVLSAILGVSIMMLVKEPNAQRLSESKNKKSLVSVFVKNVPKVLQLFKYPTFVLILCQGAPGTAPWTVFPNFTQWLQLSCFTNSQAGMIFSAFNWGNAFSNLVGGFLLNFVAHRFPNRGPPSLANFSVASGIPYLILLFFVLPKPEAFGEGGSEVPLYFVCFLLFGLCAAMCGTINKKVFSDIVPAEIYTYVFAIDQVIEQSIGNLFPLTLGILVDKGFGFDVSVVTDDSCAPDEAKKLGLGMFIVCNIAWAICFSVYLGMHRTYPKDRLLQLEIRQVAMKANTSKLQEYSSEATSEYTSRPDIENISGDN